MLPNKTSLVQWIIKKTVENIKDSEQSSLDKVNKPIIYTIYSNSQIEYNSMTDINNMDILLKIFYSCTKVNGLT